jgi:hypothetical protein
MWHTYMLYTCRVKTISPQCMAFPQLMLFSVIQSQESQSTASLVTVEMHYSHSETLNWGVTVKGFTRNGQTWEWRKPDKEGHNLYSLHNTIINWIKKMRTRQKRDRCTHAGTHNNYLDS